MKAINRYVIVSIVCGLMILSSSLYLLFKPYPYNDLDSYIIISEDYFDNYSRVLLHDKEYASLLEIPMPDKKGLLVKFDSDNNVDEELFTYGQSLEIHVKEASTYKLECLKDSELVYEADIVDSKTIIDYKSIGKDFNEIKVTAIAGNSFGVHYIGIQKVDEVSKIQSDLVETGIVRSQLKDIAGIEDGIKELALVSPYDAIGAVAFYDSFEEGVLTIKLLNIHERIITLLGIENSKGKLISKIDNIKIEAIDMATVKNSEDLSYHQLSFKIKDKIEKDDLYLRYYISGSPKESLVKLNIFPRHNYDLYNETMVNQESNIDSFDFVQVNDSIISFRGDYVSLDKTMFIPKDHLLVIQEGQTIDIINGAYIDCESPIRFNGSADNPIKFITSDATGKGIFINHANSNESIEQISTIDYTIFDGLDTPSSGAFVLTGGVTFYKSDVHITNSQFLNNVCEDSLNIVSSEFTIDGCFFDHAPSDCLDGDFAKGVIKNSKFANIEGDAIDFSASYIEVYDCEMSNVSDKAVSGGEQSVVYIDGARIIDAQIALASKDSSRVYGENIYISNSKIGYMLYQKKPEYDGGYMEVKDSVFEDNGGIPYLIQEASTLYIDGEELINLEHKNQDEIIEKVINGEPIE